MRGVWIAVPRVTAVAIMILVFAPPGAAATAAGAAAAVEATTSAAPAAAQVPPGDNAVVDFGFEPPTLAATAGDSVTWTNQGARPHTVTDRAGTFDTDPLLPGETGTVEFTVPGRYLFFCRVNPETMNGVIVVAPGAGGSGTTRVQAVDGAREGEQLGFDPSELTVPAGSTVQFANAGGAPHTMTADDRSFNTPRVNPGAADGRFAGGALTFTVPRQPGEYSFICAVHPYAMRGVLTVVAGPAPPDEGGGGQTAQPPPTAPATAEVAMADFGFDAPEVSAAPGGQVTWTNRGQAPHTATFDDVDLDTGRVRPGTRGALTAPREPGSYTYFCAVHPDQMRGVLVVVPPGTADPTGELAPPPAAAEAAAADPAGDGAFRGLTPVILVAAVIGALLGGLVLIMRARSRKRPGPPQPPSQPKQPIDWGSGSGSRGR